MKRTIVQLTRSKGSVMSSLSRSVVTLGLLALFLLPVGVSAQMTVGIGGGLVSSTWTGGSDFLTDPDAESVTGFSVGARVAIPFGGRFAFVPGVVYVQKGVAFTVDADNNSERTVNYLEVPLLVSVGVLGEDSPVGLSVFAGPTIAFEIGCTDDTTVLGTASSADCDPATDDDRETTDIGAAVGAVVLYPVSESLSISLSAGVDFGLRKIDTTDPDPEDIKNRALFVSVGVGFPIGD